MPTLEEQKVEEQRLEAEQAAADKKAADEAVAQFEAGFSGTETPEPTEKKDSLPAEEVKDPDAKADEAEKVKEAEVKELQEEIKLAQMTEEQLNRVLAYGNTIAEVKTAMDKQFGTAFGKMGGLERVIKDLQAATPVGQPITVTEADLTELKDEFPDVSKKLATGLTRVLS